MASKKAATKFIDGDGARIVRIPLVGRDVAKLMRWKRNGEPDLYWPLVGKPRSWPSLLRRVQESLTPSHRGAPLDAYYVEMTVQDLNDGINWWTTGTDGIVGKGGWQDSWPMRSIKEYLRKHGGELPTVAPMFIDVPDAGPPSSTPWPKSWAFFYVKRFVKNDDRVKLGYGTMQQALRTSGTDNSGAYTVLLVEPCASRADARAYKKKVKARFADYHVDDASGDIFFLHHTLMAFIIERQVAQGGSVPAMLRVTKNSSAS